MTYTIKLEREDGTPAEPPSIKIAITNWRAGDTIPLDAKRTLQVVRVRDDDTDQPPVLVAQTVGDRGPAPRSRAA
jgi:hypothetical protein